VPQVLLVIKETKELLGSKVQQVYKVYKALQEQQEIKVIRERQESKVQLVYKGQLVI
jgi:hypothetical protein